jgi:hypothetical protein
LTAFLFLMPSKPLLFLGIKDQVKNGS